MKYFDLVDTNDTVIGSATAAECHSNPDLIHRVVHFTLVDGLAQKILISKRSKKVKFDSGLWCFMGEHVLQGEDYQTAVFKGMRDELGLRENEGMGEYGHTIFYQKQQTEFARFFAVYYQQGELKPDPQEIEQVQWITLEELKKNKSTYSQMTQYWIEQVNWEEMLRFASAFVG